MKWFLTLLIFVCTGVVASGQTLRVATYNLNFANRDGDAVLDAISEANADILCLQETTPQSERFLRKHLAATYPEFHAVGHKGKHFAERFVFASKLEARDLVFVPPADGPFGFYCGTFNCEGTDIRVVNVHLLPFVVPRNASIVDAMAAGGATEKIHAAEIAAILNVTNSAEPAIVAGDLNSLSTFLAPAALKDSGFIDSFASVHANADMHHTWQWPTRPLPLHLRIDYIFHTQHFRTVDSTIIRREGSDHSLLVSEVEIGKR